jgi:hypothetical protein
MNTTIISHRMFVAALTNDAGAQDKSSPAAYSPRASNDAGQPVTSHLTVEQLAAMAMRYWPDFPFGGSLGQHAE